MVEAAENQLKSRIQERLDATGKSKHAVSKAIGANAGYLRDLLDPDKKVRSVGADKLRALAHELDTTVDYLSGEAQTPEQPRSEARISDEPLPMRSEDLIAVAGIPLVGTGDCAELEVCDERGEMVAVERSSFDPEHHVRLIARPPALRGAGNLYAIYFHGESMLPRFEPGEVGIVDPGRPPRVGDYVLVQLNAGDSDDVVSVLVKRLVRQNTREIVLEQFNPSLTFTIPKSRVARVHRILQQTDLLFG